MKYRSSASWQIDCCNPLLFGADRCRHYRRCMLPAFVVVGAVQAVLWRLGCVAGFYRTVGIWVDKAIC